jgi:hypothetical protein
MPTLLALELLEVIAASNLSQSDLSAFIRSHRYFYLSLTFYLYQYNKRYFGELSIDMGCSK